MGAHSAQWFSPSGRDLPAHHGSNDPKDTEDNPDGTEEKREIQEFNTAHEEQGWIRVATVGYYQYPEGEDEYEDDGRRLLRSLADPDAYFETDEASKIASFLRRSMKARRRERREHG